MQLLPSLWLLLAAFGFLLLVVGAWSLWSTPSLVADLPRGPRFISRYAVPPQAGDDEILAVVPESGEVSFHRAHKDLTTRFVASTLPYVGDFGCGLGTVVACRTRATWLLEDATRRGILAIRVAPEPAPAPVKGTSSLAAFLARRLRRLVANPRPGSSVDEVQTTSTDSPRTTSSS